MIAFITRRLVIAVALLLGLSYGVWLLTTFDGAQLLGHPTLAGLIPTAYLHFLNQVLHGDLGVSLRTGSPVLQGMGQLLLASALVIIPAFILQEIAAVSLGILAATRKHIASDRLITVLVTTFSSLPLFWFCLTLLIIFAEILHWFPFGDLVNYRTIGFAFNTPQYWAYFRSHFFQSLVDLVWHLTLPVLALALVGISTDALLVRSSMLDVLSEDYIRAARARGLPQRRVLWRHALRNALLPLLTSLGLQLPRLVFAASLVEFVFDIPGLGRLFLRAVYTPPNASAGASEPKDPHVITAYFLILGVVTVASSLLTDLAYAVADPRVRTGGSGGARCHGWRWAA